MHREPLLLKFFKLHSYFFVVIGAISFGVAIFMGHTAIAKQMDDWMLLPRPQRFTELYFTDHTLPASLKRGASQKLTFTVHNLEHRPTAYHYKLIGIPDDTRPQQVLGEGVVNLAHDQSKTIDQSITVPTVGAQLAIRVDLQYDGILFGANTPTTETQSIQFWVKLTGGAAHASN
jgi:hypothetical protein